MVRYYGWYSNRARGERAKQAAERAEVENPCNLQVIDVSDYEPLRLPSKKWRELIKKVWEVDPFDCPRCGAEMKMIALIDDGPVIEKILRHLGLWPRDAIPARAPPEPPRVGCCGYSTVFPADAFDLPVPLNGSGKSGCEPIVVLQFRDKALLFVVPMCDDCL